MFKQLKKLAPVTVLSLALMMMTASPALADFSVGNTDTGAESDNAIGTDISTELEYRNINSEDVDNDFPVEVNSGGNTSEFEDGSEIETGDIELAGEFQNDLNANAFDQSSDFDPEGEVFNDFTGFDSDNEASVVINFPMDLFNYNLAEIGNLGGIFANSGYNLSDFNLGFSYLGTGDADLEIDGENVANANFSELEDFLGAGEIEVGNSGTGPESDNEAEVDIDTELAIANRNYADIDNELFVSANTGCNEVEFNSGDDCDCFGLSCACGGFGGGLETGDADLAISLINRANENKTVVNSNWDLGSFAALNEGTGFDSDNEAEIEYDSDLAVESQNNADIDNEIAIMSNTGHNSITANSGSENALETGDALSEVAIENAVNSNVTEIDGGFGGEIAVGNACTGAESDNEAEVDIDQDVDVSSQNNADIDNDVVVSTNTGYNLSEFNGFGDCDTCGSEGSGILTGDAEANVAIENQVNSNVTEISNFGDLDIEAVNEGTGFGSDNSAVVDYSNDVNIINQNYADIDNNVVVNSNTGNNVSNFNGGSSISTGNSSVTFGVSNTGNTNVVKGN